MHKLLFSEIKIWKIYIKNHYKPWLSGTKSRYKNILYNINFILKINKYFKIDSDTEQ